MCYAIPGKITALDQKIVIVDYFGQEKRAINELEGLSIGDYIYAQGGYVIERIAPERAESILNVWRETFFELQEVDVRLSQMGLDDKGPDKDLSLILDRILEGGALSLKDMDLLLSLESPQSIELMAKAANFIRQRHLQNSCCVHGIIEISNDCTQACSYCGIWSGNSRLRRYHMGREEIITTACEAVRVYGFRALVLQSGQTGIYSIADLEYIIKAIKEQVGVLICISFGEIGVENLGRLYAAGARGLLMRFETSNPNLYAQLHPGSFLDTRLEHIGKAYDMGYLIMTGALIGLPGQTNEDIIADIILAKKLRAEMFSFGPFLPHPDTVLAEVSPPSEDLIIKTLALARFIDQANAKILITTAFETLSDEACRKGLLAGANSVMLNITPEDKRLDYEIYPNRKYAKTAISDQIEATLSLLRSLGRAPTDLGVA